MPTDQREPKLPPMPEWCHRDNPEAAQEIREWGRSCYEQGRAEGAREDKRMSDDTWPGGLRRRGLKLPDENTPAGQYARGFRAGRAEQAERGLQAPSRWGIDYPVVHGKCPACNLRALFLAQGGYVTCSNLSCRQPEAATDLLEDHSDD